MVHTVVALSLLVACSGKTPTANTPTPAPTPAAEDFSPNSSVVQLTTSDGVSLEADWHRATDGGPALVLLHMIPPSNDRSNWPASFVTLLMDQGWSVLAVDRRGAGASEGEATEAYQGPNGRLDVVAAVDFVVDQGHETFAIIGASNGTTSMIDYTAGAGASDPQPVALGFMTGGNYTESQTQMDALPEIPAVFTFSTNERAWSVAQEPLNPGSWSFLEYPNGAHGTRMFGAAPAVADDLVSFLAPVFEEADAG